MTSIVRRGVALVSWAWTILGLTLLCLVVLEFLVATFLSSPAVRDERITADAYSDSPWVEDYFREFRDSLSVAWQPYLYWRRAPYEGEYINITAAGIRYTPTPPDDDGLHNGKDRPTVFVFGGSTIWGTGARDSATIPALIAKTMFDQGLPVAVTNLGETGFVSTQELIYLILQIKEKKIPDVVVFYDGINNTFSSYQQSAAGWPQNEFRRHEEFNVTQRSKKNDLRRIALTTELQSTATLQLLEDTFAPSEFTRAWQQPIALETNTERLAEDTVTLYMKDIEMATVLGNAYGFQVLSYWQPTILDKDELSPHEASQRALMPNGLVTFFEQTYRILRTRADPSTSSPSVHDISGIFEDVSEPIFIDPWHVGERGNRTIAERIAEDLIQIVRGS